MNADEPILLNGAYRRNRLRTVEPPPWKQRRRSKSGRDVESRWTYVSVRSNALGRRRFAGLARMNSAADPGRSKVVNVRLATGLALLVTGVILGLWLWSRICRFPSVLWNDLRLAPTIAFAQGWAVFPPSGQGVGNTWLYGPLPVLFFCPATWEPTAAGAQLVAAVLNVALTLVPFALVYFARPGADRDSDAAIGRLVAFLLCVALWPERH